MLQHGFANAALKPIPFTWPLGAVCWLVFLWAYWPEFRILREAGRAQRTADAATRDPSLQPLVMGQRIVLTLALLVAVFVPGLAMRQHREAIYAAGLLVVMAGSLLRRHCFRMLGDDFRGAVTVRPDQPVIERGAYRFLRHPSYAAALVLHLGFALCFTHWGTLAIVLLGAPPLFVYRIRVEERALVERIGAPYVAYMARTRRLVPGIW
jgi:protein-S-isoprenylcysteine O-methyltransferase Ste14